MKVKRKIIEIDESLCNGCGECVTACQEGAIQIVDGKAKVINDSFCDGLGACIGDCPEDALKIVEREAEAFDEAAVEKHLARLEHLDPIRSKPDACGCPSASIQTFSPQSESSGSQTDSGSGTPQSALAQWPIQIHLIPPNAPFLNNADLLIAADCVPAACPDFHQGLLRGKILMLGCPKFDDNHSYLQKFTAIFQSANIKRVTIAVMEVPCCSGLPKIVKEALTLSGRDIPLEEVIVNIRDGQVIERFKN